MSIQNYTKRDKRDDMLEESLGRLHNPASSECLRMALDEVELYGAIDRLKELQAQGQPILAHSERRTYSFPQKIAIYEQMNHVLALVGEGGLR